MSTVAAKAVDWTETGLVPDTVIRHGIRRLLDRKLKEIRAASVEDSADIKNAFVAMMNASPVAPVPDKANEQHYEVPAEFFASVLGPRRKYSCCLWPDGVDAIGEAEREALKLTTQRAQIADGMRILELGCGWGSLTLWIAENFPNSHVTAVSNSRSQHDFITARARETGIRNIDVRVADMNTFATEQKFDRIVSVEMFEHMRNYGELFKRIAHWLENDGRFFMHIFCHRTTPYEFIDKGPSDWMSRHFFSGGIMPSADLPLLFPEHLNIESRWHWSGQHYARTLRAWLDATNACKAELLPILAATYGAASAERWWMRWRIFFMACEELFAYRDGEEWFIGHYLLRRAGN